MRARTLWGLIFIAGIICGVILARELFPSANAEIRGDDLQAPYTLSEREWLQTRLDIAALRLSLTGQKLATFSAWIAEDLKIYCRIHIPSYWYFNSLPQLEQQRNYKILIDSFNEEIVKTIEQYAPHIRETFDLKRDVVGHVLLTRQELARGSILQEGSPLIEVAKFENGEFSWVK